MVSGFRSPVSGSITVNQKLRSIYLPFVYVFTGDGDWNIPGNWFNNMIPEAPVSNNNEIYINPAAGGQCYFTGNLMVQQGAKLVVQPGKKLTIQPE